MQADIGLTRAPFPYVTTVLLLSAFPYAVIVHLRAALKNRVILFRSALQIFVRAAFS